MSGPITVPYAAWFEVGCPSCRAEGGKPCTSVTGKRTSTHASRTTASRWPSRPGVASAIHLVRAVPVANLDNQPAEVV